MSLAPGTRLGPYELTALLGVGGMGEVYRARDTRLHRDVAIKILTPSFSTDPERLARFEREARVLASLSHPNIAAIYDIEDTTMPTGARMPVLVLELVEGPTLREELRRGRLPLNNAVPIALQIAQGLEVAHERGIVHRDLKPENVKLTSDSDAKILDFGLAKALEPEAPADHQAESRSTVADINTGIGIVMGSPPYMAPEQIHGGAAEADISGCSSVARTLPGA